MEKNQQYKEILSKKRLMVGSGIVGAILLLVALGSIVYRVYNLWYEESEALSEVVVTDEIESEEKKVEEAESEGEDEPESGEEDNLSEAFKDFEYVWYEDDYIKFKYPGTWKVEVESGVIKVYSEENEYYFKINNALGHGVNSWSFNKDEPFQLWICSHTCGPEFLKLDTKPEVLILDLNTGFELEYLSVDLNGVEYVHLGEPDDENTSKGQYEYKKDHEGKAYEHLIALRTESDSFDYDFTNSILFKQKDLVGEVFFDDISVNEQDEPMIDFEYSNYFYDEDNSKIYLEIVQTFFNTVERVD